MLTQAIILDNGEVVPRPPAPTASQPAPVRLAGSGAVLWDTAPSITRIELDAASVSPGAFARLGDWIADLGPRTLVWLVHHDGIEPGFEMLFGRDAITKALASRRDRHGRNGKIYLRHISDPDDIPNHMTELQKVLAIWREDHQTLSADVAIRLSEANEMRLVIVRPTSDRGHLVHSHGFGYDDCISRWLAANIGSPISAWPDQTYGEETDRGFRETMARSRPLHDEIDCNVVWPGGKRQRRCYRRLLLPFGGNSSNPLLVIATRLDETIDLRGTTAAAGIPPG